MLRYAFGRATQAAATLIIVVCLVFFMTHSVGDPVSLMLPLDAPEVQRQAVRAAMGFDDPLYVQFADFITGVLRGDVGESLRYQRPAMPLALERLGATLWLAGTAMALTIFISVPLGVWAARRPGSRRDRFLSGASMAGISIPEFWLAQTLVIVFGIRLDWLPTSGYGGWEFIVLPVLALLPRRVGRVSQMLRSSLVEERLKPYILTAQAKGIAPRQIERKHQLRNAVVPMLTLAGDELAVLMGGAIIVEVVMAWPGIGQLTLVAIEQRDFPVVIASVVIVATLILALNTLIDVLYKAIDPRIRL